MGSDTLSGALSRETGENAGTYAIQQNDLTDDNNPNYAITFTGANFTIQKKPLTEDMIVITPKSFQYDGTEHAPTCSMTDTGLKAPGTELTASDYTVGGSTSGTSFNVYTVTFSGTGNYSGRVSSTWSISTVEDQEVQYDGQSHTVTPQTPEGESVKSIKYGTAAGEYTLDTPPSFTDAGKNTIYYQMVLPPYVSGGADRTVEGQSVLTITPAPIIVNAKAAESVYNEDIADLTDKYEIDGTVYSQNETQDDLGVTVSTTVQKGDAVGTYTGAVTLTISNPNYTLTSTTAADYTVTKRITAASVTASGWTYGDEAVSPTLTYSDGDETRTVTYKYKEKDAADDTYSETVPTKAGSYVVRAQIGESANYQELTTEAVEFEIAKKELTITGLTATERVYDGTTAVTISGGTLSGAVSEDNVSFTATSGTIQSANAGTDLPVTLGEASLTGTDAGNYTLKQPENLTVNITQKPVTVSGITANNKVYDGNTNADLNVENAVFTGILDSDALTVTAFGAFADADAGSGKNVTISGLTLGGDSVGNYLLADSGNQASTTADITPADLTAVSAEQSGTLKYDGANQTPTVSTSATAVNDQTVTFAYSTTEGSYGAMPTFKDAGEHTVYYQITAPNHNAAEGSFTVTVEKRNVTLTSADASKVYDGAALTANGTDSVTVGGEGFPEGEGATYNVTESQTLPGSSENTFTYKLNEGTNADNYEITTATGMLTVTDRNDPNTEEPNNPNKKYEITLTANSDTVLYDGTEHSVSGFTEALEYTFNGVTYEVSGVEASASATDAGETTAAITGTPVVTIKDGDGTNLADQFIVNKVPGKLTITKRSVTLTSATDSKNYDGNALTNSDVTVTGDGFIDGEGATFDVTGSQKVVGSSANAFTYTLNSNTKADNYTITTSEGTLTVTDRTSAGSGDDSADSQKYEITLTASSGEFQYDGRSHSVSGFTDALEYTFDGVTYEVSGVDASARATDAGETAVAITGTPVVTVKGGDGTDLAEQFIVNAVPGKLTITKRSVTLTSATDSKTYDGTALTNDTVTVSGDGFVDGEGAEYNVTGSQRTVGSSSNTFTYTLNSGTKADNYTITTVYGVLTVDVQPLSVTAEGWTGVYDGETHGITVNAPNGAAVTYSSRQSGPYQAENYAYKDAGTYTVYYRVTADGLPEAAGSAVVTITKASLSPVLTLVDPSNPDTARNSWPYGGPAGIPRLVMERTGTDAAVTDYGIPVYSYRTAGSAAYQGYTPQETMETLPVGSYTLRMETAESRNYYAASAEVDFNIIKASHSDVTPEAVKVLANSQNLPLDLSAYLVGDSACAISGFSGNLISGAPSVTNSILRFDTGASGNGQINVRVSSPNFEDYTITVSLRGATSFSLRFDSNGGSVVKTTRSRRPGAAYSALPTTKRTGYVFDGWFTERDGGEIVSTSTKMGNIDTTLYAHWTAIDYTVTLRLNGGSLPAGLSGWTGSGGVWTRTFHADTPDFTLPEPVLEGYTFTGWIRSAGLPCLTVTIPEGTTENLSYDADWMECILESEVEFSRTEEESDILGFYDAEQDSSQEARQESGLTDTLREIAAHQGLTRGCTYFFGVYNNIRL